MMIQPGEYILGDSKTVSLIQDAVIVASIPVKKTKARKHVFDQDDNLYQFRSGVAVIAKFRQDKLFENCHSFTLTEPLEFSYSEPFLCLGEEGNEFILIDLEEYFDQSDDSFAMQWALSMRD
jgi:hypothetical protein